jgi:integrase
MPAAPDSWSRCARRCARATTASAPRKLTSALARQYILFCGKRHPSEFGAREVSAGISHLAVKRKVSASTQTQALSALLFLYREVLSLPIGRVDDVERAKKPERMPVVFTREEARAVLSHLRGELWLMASLLYGSGLRLFGA